MSGITLIPGWAFPATSMAGVKRRLARRFGEDVTVLDHATPSDTEDMSASGRMRVVDRVMQQVDAFETPRVLLGWSMGGRLAIEIALARPEKVRALVLVCTSARFCAGPDYPHGYAVANVRALSQAVRRDPQEALRGFFSSATTAGAFGDNYVDSNIAKILAHGVEPLLDGLAYLQTVDHRERLSQVVVPSLVLHGEADTLIPWRAGEALAEGLSRATFLMHGEAGHDLLLSHSDWMINRIEEWMETWA